MLGRNQVVRSMVSYRQEPQWGLWSQVRHQSVPHGMVDWLRDRDSLTARLKRVSGGDFRVRLMGQGWGRPLPSEQRLLKMQRGEIAVIRQVQLICRGRPWVFARTLIPARSLTGPPFSSVGHMSSESRSGLSAESTPQLLRRSGTPVNSKAVTVSVTVTDLGSRNTDFDPRDRRLGSSDRL